MDGTQRPPLSKNSFMISDGYDDHLLGNMVILPITTPSVRIRRSRLPMLEAPGCFHDRNSATSLIKIKTATPVAISPEKPYFI